MGMRSSRRGRVESTYPLKSISKTFSFTKSEFKAKKKNMISGSKNITDGFKKCMLYCLIRRILRPGLEITQINKVVIPRNSNPTT